MSTWPPTTGPNQTMQRTRESDRRKETWQGCGNIMTHRGLKESAAKGILKIFSKMWKPRSGDSAQSLQIFLRQRRQGHIKCKHHEQSEKPSNVLSDSAGIPWQQQLSICTSPARKQQKCHGKWLVDTWRDSDFHPGSSLGAAGLGHSLCLFVPHLAYLPTSQAQMHHRYGSSQSVSASGFFLFSLIFPSAGGLLLSPPVRCSVMLSYSLIWHHFPQFQSFSSF